jgi:hypothetical protein
MLRTGHLLRPASNPASRPRTGASLPGTLASPRTGLAPAGCPQLLAWLRHHNMNLLVVMASKLLDALPNRRIRSVSETLEGPSRRLPCRAGTYSGMKQDAGTPRSGPEVPLGNVRLSRMAALRQTAATRRRSPDRPGHHRDTSTDPTQNAAATERQKVQESTTGVNRRPPANTGPIAGRVSRSGTSGIPVPPKG